MLELDNAILSQIESRGLAGLWQWDICSDRFEGSPGVERILGVMPNAIEGMGAIESLVHPDDRIDWSDPFRNAREGLYDYRAMRIIRPNGEMRWVSLRSSVQYDRNGEPKSLMGILIDESDHAFRRKSSQVAESRSAALDLMEGISIWHADPAGLIKDMSNWKSLTGLENHKAKGTGWLSQVPEEERLRVVARWAVAMSDGKAFDIIHHLKTLGGNTHLVQTRGLLTRGINGAVREWIGLSVVLPEAILDQRGGSDLAISVSLLTPSHFRAARGFLGWTALKLAEMSGLSLSTVRRLEDPLSHQIVQDGAIAAARAALERSGISFWLVPGGEYAISLRDKTPEAGSIAL